MAEENIGEEDLLEELVKCRKCGTVYEKAEEERAMKHARIPIDESNLPQYFILKGVDYDGKPNGDYYFYNKEDKVDWSHKRLFNIWIFDTSKIKNIEEPAFYHAPKWDNADEIRGNQYRRIADLTEEEFDKLKEVLRKEEPGLFANLPHYKIKVLTS